MNNYEQMLPAVKGKFIFKRLHPVRDLENIDPKFSTKLDRAFCDKKLVICLPMARLLNPLEFSEFWKRNRFPTWFWEMRSDQPYGSDRQPAGTRFRNFGYQ